MKFKNPQKMAIEKVKTYKGLESLTDEEAIDIISQLE